MSLITIAPVGGLCNRMRALNSALALGETIGSRVELLWYRDFLLNCRYAELFEPPANLFRVVDINMSSRFGPLLKKLFLVLRSHAGRNFYDEVDIEEAMKSGLDLEREFAGKDVFIESYSAFFGHKNYREFVPVKQIYELIETYRNRLSNAVGIHIRRTDNIRSIKHSPTEEFEKIMSGMIAAGHCNHFFLSTDSPEEERRLVEKFGDRIFSHPKNTLDRNVDTSIKDAIVDLYCLSGCKQIVGSYWSSFSETAANIGNKELIVIDIFADD